MNSPHAQRPDPVVIREATAEDLYGMARVHVETWKSAYRGIVPDERLERLSVESDIAGGFGSRLGTPRPGAAQFVAVTPAHEVVGFAVAGPNREPDPDFTGELGALYVLPSRQRQGTGTALVRECTRFLLGNGTTSMIVWVLEQNPYRRFYERLGGALVRRRVASSRIAGGPLPEVSYGWKDIRTLAHR